MVVVVVVGALVAVVVVVVDGVQTDFVVGAVCVDEEKKKRKKKQKQKQKWKKEMQTNVQRLCSFVVAVEESDLES